MTFLTQQAPPDQPMPPLIAESEGSSIHLIWVNPARPNGLLVQGFVLEYLVIEDKEAHERERRSAGHLQGVCAYRGTRVRPTTVWGRVAAVTAKGHGVFSVSSIFLTSQNESMELMQMCVPEEHAHCEATM